MSLNPKSGSPSDGMKGTNPHSSTSDSSSHDPKPHQNQPVISTSKALASSSAHAGTDQDSKLSFPSSAPQCEYDLAAIQNLPDLQMYDPECAKRVCARRNNENNMPLLSWEKLSIEYLLLFKKIKQGSVTTTVSPKEYQPSPEITRMLLEDQKNLSEDQKKWVKWALNQEANTQIRGGILDDYAQIKDMKTKAISLVVTARERKHILSAASEASSSSSEDKHGHTLLVCEGQWSVQRWKEAIEKAQKTDKRSISFCEFDGTDSLVALDFRPYDFVITTYKQVSSDDGRDDTLPLQLSWERIILVEPKMKNKQGKAAQAVCELNSEYKWVITSSTLLREREQDFHMLLHFLQVFPYSYSFCMDCDGCQKLEYRSTYQCNGCKHKFRRHFSWWHKYIALPKEVSDIDNTGKLLLMERVHKSVLFQQIKSTN